MVDATRHSLLDDRRRGRTMVIIGGEDRALLRSNPSARSDAGTEAGVQTTSELPPTPTCSGRKAQNLGGPGAEPPQRLQPRAVCHLARSSGRVFRRVGIHGLRVARRAAGVPGVGTTSIDTAS